MGYWGRIPEVELYSRVGNLFSKKGKVPKTKSIRSVALFDAYNGTILDVHHIMTMEGCEPRDLEEIEKDAVGFAKKLGHSVENLKILHAPKHYKSIYKISY